MFIVFRILVFEAFDAHKVCRTPVAPPQLSRDAPVLDAIEPAVPVVLGLFGRDEEFACLGAL
jgi:hypothetical protein